MSDNTSYGARIHRAADELHYDGPTKEVDNKFVQCLNRLRLCS